MVFHWSLSDSKSPQVSRNLLSILAFLNNVVVWMVFTRPLISKSPKSTNHDCYDCHFHVPQCFQFPNNVLVLILLLFCGQPVQQCPQICKFPFLLFSIIIRSGLHSGVYVRHSPEQMLGCGYTIIIIIIIFIIIIIIYSFDSFSYEQFSSDFQDSSQYSGRPQQCSSLDSLPSSSYFQIIMIIIIIIIIIIIPCEFFLINVI